MKRFIFLMLMITTLLVSACKNDEQKARELGFKNLAEQKEANSKGLKTKAELDNFIKQEEFEITQRNIREIEAAFKIVSCKMYGIEDGNFKGFLAFEINFLSGNIKFLNTNSHIYGTDDIINREYVFNTEESPVKVNTNGRIGAHIYIDRNSGKIRLSATKNVNYYLNGICEEVRSKF